MKIQILALLLVYLFVFASAGPVADGDNDDGDSCDDGGSGYPPKSSDCPPGYDGNTNPGGPVVPAPSCGSGGTGTEVSVFASVIVQMKGDVDAVVNLVAAISSSVKLDVCLDLVVKITIKLKAILDAYSNSCNKMQHSDSQSLLNILLQLVGVAIQAVAKLRSVYVLVTVQLDVLLKLLAILQVQLTLVLKLTTSISVDIRVTVKGLLDLIIKLGLSVIANIVLKVFLGLSLCIRVSLNLGVVLAGVLQVLADLFVQISATVKIMGSIINLLTGPIGGGDKNCNDAVAHSGTSIGLMVDVVTKLCGNNQVGSGDVMELNKVLVKIQACIKALVDANVNLSGLLGSVLSVVIGLVGQAGQCFKDSATTLKGSNSAVASLAAGVCVKIQVIIKLVISLSLSIGLGLNLGLLGGVVLSL